ncbi:MAG TPA: serine hydrolase domain-containing protein [Longimicrobiales bacterium]|nr:serine hydrolase domain-containing protein [Longimicrobiales bacterium]
MSKRWIFLAAALILPGQAACAARSEPAPHTALSGSVDLSSAALDRLGSALGGLVDAGKLAAVYGVITSNGEIIYEQTFGTRDLGTREPLERDDIFRIYSMTKPVVAVGILRLVDQGRLGLDDPVSRYLPAFARVKVFQGGTADEPVLREPARPITIRQLLNHTSGLPYGLTDSPVDTIFRRARLYDAQHTLRQFTDSLARIPPLFEPGTRWSYSSGLDVAGHVIEVVSGRTLDVFLEEEIFEPLGMHDTGFRIRPGDRERLVTVYTPGADSTLQPLTEDGLLAMFEPEARFLWGSGGLLSTPHDFLRFAHMLLNGGALGDVRILQPETVALMTQNTLPPELTPVSYPTLSDSAYGFGLGVAVKVRATEAEPNVPVGLYRWSGYLGTYFWVDPANDLVAMVWTQLSPGGAYPLQSVFQQHVYGIPDAAVETPGTPSEPPARSAQPFRSSIRFDPTLIRPGDSVGVLVLDSIDARPTIVDSHSDRFHDPPRPQRPGQQRPVHPLTRVDVTAKVNGARAAPAPPSHTRRPAPPALPP